MANWYAYTSVGDPTLSTSYRIVTTKPICKLSGVEICGLYLNQNDPIPVALDFNLTTYIANALATQIAQPTGVGVKRFVYLKGPTS